MNKKILFGLLGLFLTSILIFSCKKIDSQLNTLANGEYFNSPSIENGMLSFSNKDDFMEFQNDLLNYINASFPDDTLDLNERLNEIESIWAGFMSLRKSNYNNFMLENEVGWDNIDDIPDINVLSDPILETCLNEDGAVIIDDIIVVYLSKSIAVKFLKEKMDIYNVLMTIPNNTKEDISSIAHFINNYSTLSNMTFFDPSKDISNDIVDVPLTGGFYSSGARFTPDPCNTNKITLKRFSVLYEDPLETVIGSFSVNWGDGTSNSGSILSGLSSGAITHIYATPGTYTATISFSVSTIPSGANAVWTETRKIEILTTNCYPNSLVEKNQIAYSSDNKAMIKCKLVFRSSLLANNVQASTEYFEKNNNNKWKNVKTGNNKTLSARVYGDISFNSKCTSVSQKDFTNSKTKSKSVKAIEMIYYV